MISRHERAFEVLQQCAIDGIRCPPSQGPRAHPSLKSADISALAKAGRVRVEISGRNFRRVTILKGPNAGKATLEDPECGRVYLTLDAEGTKCNGVPVMPHRQRRQLEARR